MLLLTSVATAQRVDSPVAGQQMETLAVVNGQPISRQQVANECLRRFGENVLEDIVNKQLVLNECRRRNVVITEQDVIEDIRATAARFGLSADRYMNEIARNRGVAPEKLRNEHWHRLATRRLAEQDLTVTQEEIAKQMEFEFGESIQVREIAVNTRQEAEQILQEARANPADFERLAKVHSVDMNSASMGGMLPPVRRHSGFPQLEDVAFAMQPGEVSDIIQLEDKFIILKCETIRPAMVLTPEQETQVREELISTISENKLKEAAIDLFMDLQQRVNIVNVMNDEQLSREMPGVAAMVDQTRITRQMVAEECIARFGRDMLETEIMRTLMIQELRKANMQVSSEDINHEIARVAAQYGFLKSDGSPDINGWVAFTTRDDPSKEPFYLEDEVWPSVAMRMLVEDSVTVTDEDLQKSFESNFGPRVEVLVVMLSDQRTALKVWRMATANPDREYFGQLAGEYSIDPTSQMNYGEVPPIRRHGGSSELENEAFALQPGEISRVVQAGQHWVIMYCKGQTTPRITDFEVVRDELYADIFEKKVRIATAERYYQVRESAQIDNFLAGTSQTGQDAVRAAQQQSPNANRKP
ncbi:MAG: peptidylprolyl isomerase [Planctomycetota bacterium]